MFQPSLWLFFVDFCLGSNYIIFFVEALVINPISSSKTHLSYKNKICVIRPQKIFKHLLSPVLHLGVTFCRVEGNSLSLCGTVKVIKPQAELDSSLFYSSCPTHPGAALLPQHRSIGDRICLVCMCLTHNLYIYWPIGNCWFMYLESTWSDWSDAFHCLSRFSHFCEVL